VSDVFQPEQVVGGRYRVVRKLGGGGMADVYLCEDLTLGRHVAIKVLLQRYLDDPTFVERFRREAKAAAGLNQQNLVSIYDWGEVDGTYYIAMEYVEGETLKDLIRRRGRLSGNESVAVTMQLLAAVDFAHRSGIVHRDIKPQNVMLDRSGTVKVMDFGIARAGDSGMTEAGSILGTAQYLAPEQAKGYPVDERSDLYSVGVCLYEMLTGTVPFKGDSAVTVALKHVNEVPAEPAELVPGLPYALNQIVLKAMAKDPADRYQSAAEFARDLRAAREGGPVQAAAFDAAGERTRVMGAAGMTAAEVTSVLDQPLPPRRTKSKWPVILIVLLLAIIAAVAVALWWTMSGDKVEVPSVVGLSRAAAVRALEQEGFKVAVQEEFSDRVAEGFVSRQAPTRGTKLREGATVDIWVSKGSQKAAALPDFTGWTASMVDDWLAQNDLKGDQHTGRSNAVSEGQVFRQDPAADTVLNRGDTVSYWVSRGKPEAEVPDLAGKSQADAEAALTDAGLVGAATQETSSTVPAGTVISQDPPAGTKVEKGSTVSYVVSTGSPSPTPTPTPSPTASAVEVPNVYGMQSAVAEQQLTALGLATAFRQKANTGQQPGTVVNVRPDAGTFVPEGSTVLLVIAS